MRGKNEQNEKELSGTCRDKKNTISEIKMSLDKINCRLDTAEEKTELEDIAITKKKKESKEHQLPVRQYQMV